MPQQWIALLAQQGPELIKDCIWLLAVVVMGSAWPLVRMTRPGLVFFSLWLALNTVLIASGHLIVTETGEPTTRAWILMFSLAVGCLAGMNGNTIHFKQARRNE